MNRYELTYIINTALEETARKELVEKFTELIKLNGGEIEKVDESWGKRHLAYPIDDMPDGYFVLTTFKASGSQNKEIQRNLEINDMILRYLIIKLLDKKQSVKPKPVRPVAVPVKEEAQPVQAEPEAEQKPAKPAAKAAEKADAPAESKAEPEHKAPAAPEPAKDAVTDEKPDAKAEEPKKETAEQTE